MKKTKWEDIVNGMNQGKSFKELTKNIPSAVKIKKRRFKTYQISTKQIEAIRRK